MVRDEGKGQFSPGVEVAVRVSKSRRGQAGAEACALTPLLAVVFLFIAAIPVQAETWKGVELERRWREAPWKFGPLRIQPQIVIRNAGVDSNIYYSPSDPVRDFTLTAGPAATVYIPLHRRLIVSAYGTPQYVWYAKTERERTWNHYFNGAVSISLRNIFISVEGRYSDARERWNTEIDIRPRRKEEGYGGSVLVKTSRKTSFEVAYRTADYDYESILAEGGFDVRERLNRTESYATVSMFYQASTQRRFFVDLEYGEFDFMVEEQAAIKDSRSGAVYAGLEFSPLGRRVRGKMRLGYKKFDIRNPEGEDFQGLAGDAQLSVRVAKPFVVRGSYVRDVRFSLWYSSAYYVESRPGAGISFYPTRFLRLDYNYSFGRNSYPAPQEVEPGVEVKRRDDFDIHSAGIYVRLWQSTALGFVASRWLRDSNLDREDDKRWFYGVNLTYEF